MTCAAATHLRRLPGEVGGVFTEVGYPVRCPLPHTAPHRSTICPPMSSASLPGTTASSSAKTPPRPSVHLQAALRRHVLTRCEHPRHACRTNTPGEGPVPCYRACHEHPRRLASDTVRTRVIGAPLG